MADEEILEPRGYILNRGTIGEGAYSKVRSAFSRKINQDCAIKCIDKRNAPDDFVKKFLPRELEILPKLNHKNIIRVYEILAVSDGRVYIVMDFGKKGDLLRYIQSGSAIFFLILAHEKRPQKGFEDIGFENNFSLSYYKQTGFVPKVLTSSLATFGGNQSRTKRVLGIFFYLF